MARRPWRPSGTTSADTSPPEDAVTFRPFSPRRRAPSDPLAAALAAAARACGIGEQPAAAVLAQSPDIKGVLDAFEARRWADASRFNAFDAARDNAILYVLRNGGEACAAVAVLDPLEPYAQPQLVRPAVTLDAAERALVAGLPLASDWQDLPGGD